MNKINQEIFKLWNQAPTKFKKRLPLLYHEQHRNPSIVFVGLNPSFSNKGFKKIIKDEKEFNNIPISKIKQLYNLKSFNKQNLKLILRIEELAFRKHDYFSKFHNIGEEFVLKWNHVDLFLVRNTNQKSIEKMYNSRQNQGFFNEQIELSWKYAFSFKPKLIVICNAYASDLIQKKYCSSLTFDSKMGAYKINNRKLPYLIFSGMLTGARALDRGSFNSLKWHINFILNNHH